MEAALERLERARRVMAGRCCDVHEVELAFGVDRRRELGVGACPGQELRRARPARLRRIDHRDDLEPGRLPKARQMRFGGYFTEARDRAANLLHR